MKKITFLFVLLSIMSLGVFLTVSCEKKEQEPHQVLQESQVLNLNFTSCKKSEKIWKGSKLSGNVEVEFTDRGVQITYNNFKLACNFTTVDVTFTFENGVLSITQKGDGDADCMCFTDVSYTISGILQNQVKFIFINEVQVYPTPEEPQVLNVNFTPCKQEVLKGSKISGNVVVEFTDRGVHITYYDFEVHCDFTTVDVSFTFENGILSITQYSYGEANCICPTDVSYTISGILQNQVDEIQINGQLVYW